MSQGGVQPVSEQQSAANLPLWVTSIARTVNLLLRGKSNSVKVETFTLTAGATSTTLTDERLGDMTVVSFMPLTANAATAKGTIWIDTQLQGSCVVHHANNAQTDKSFTVMFTG